jgi:molybdate transport system ATP-binding protein
VRLTGLDARRPAHLSGGQQQRVAIARALALHPQLLLLDEPLAALDVQTRREIRQELRRILSDVRITTVLVTHQYLEALLFGHQILVLEHGRILQQGGRRDLLEHPRSSYVAELVGVNFFHGRLLRYEMNAMCVVQLQNDHQSVEITAALKERGEIGKERPTGHLPTVGEEAYIIVEPRSVTLYSNPPDSSARNVFCGSIVQILHLGAFPGEATSNDGRVRVSIQLDDSMPPLTAEITETSANRMQLSEGKQIYAAFKATEAWAYV